MSEKIKKNRLSITQEITITVVAIFILMITLLGVIVGNIIITNNNSKLEWQKKMNVELLTTLLVEPFWTLDVTTINKMISNFVSDKQQVIAIRALDQYANVLTVVQVPTYQDDFEKLKFDKGNSVVEGSIYKFDEYLGRVEIIYSTKKFVDDVIWQLVTLCLFFLVVGFLFGFVILWHLKRRIAAPIGRIVYSAKLMSQGIYNFQVDDEPVHEFQEMAESINLAIRAIKKRDNELQNNLKELQVATDAKTKFVSTISHEIRTPLNAIIGLTDLTLQGEVKDEDTRENLEIVKLSADSLLTLVDDILDFSKLEAEKIVIQNNQFNLYHMLQECIQIVHFQAASKNIDILFDFETGEENFYSDQKRIRQVVLNLLNNAIKFSHENSEIIFKVQRVVDSEAYAVLRFEVIDYGIGIKKENIDSLFQAFSQIDQSTTRQFSGSGLGLSISKKLIELMDGIIGVESQYGEGSQFWFQIKLLKHRL